MQHQRKTDHKDMAPWAHIRRGKPHDDTPIEELTSGMAAPDDTDEHAGDRAWETEPTRHVAERRAAAAATDEVLRDTSRDPWAHRSAGLRCDTCMWYVAKQRQSVARIHETDSKGNPIGAGEPFPTLSVGTIGRCRRRSPTISGYPGVYPTDWCGDHKLDETK
jgi:hypothetical protein